MKFDKVRVKELDDLRFKSICFMIFLLLVVGLSIFTIRTSIIKPDDKKEEEKFNYRTTNNINYKVHLQPNDLFDEQYIGMDKQYATDVIEWIEIDFANTLSVSRSAIIEYDYEILATLIGTYSSDSSRKETEIWPKNFVLLDRVNGRVTKARNVIKEKIELDFPYYNQLVNDFKKELRLNIDAQFTIIMTINYKVRVGGEIIKKTEELSLEFPLGKAAFSIKTNVPDKYEEVIYEPIGSHLIINTPFVLLGIIFLLIALILFITFIKKIITLNKKSEYASMLNKIIKNFGDVIAESKTPVDSSKYEILEIVEFEDLVDIQSEVRIPIIYFEKTKNLEGWFTLVHNDLLYRYILYGRKSSKKYKHSKSL